MLFMLSVLACGSGEEPSSPSNDDSGSPTSTATSDTGTPPESTWECGSWASCQSCGANNCLTEVSACVYDAACSPAVDAWAGCVDQCGNPDDCAATFEAAGGALATALLECVAMRCSAACGML